MARFRRIGTLIGAVLLLSVLGGTAFADDEDDLRDRLNEAREHLAELGADPSADIVAAREIERARIDIDQAADRLANHREELAEVAVIRVENRVKLIEAVIDQATMDELAEERESANIAMTREADQAQVQYEATEARRDALREEVSEILQQLEVGND